VWVLVLMTKAKVILAVATVTIRVVGAVAFNGDVLCLLGDG
jgi:hypothetical protein